MNITLGYSILQKSFKIKTKVIGGLKCFFSHDKDFKKSSSSTCTLILFQCFHSKLFHAPLTKFCFQDNLDNELGELTCSTSPMSSVSTSLDSSFPTPPLHGSSNVIIQRGARRLSGKTGSSSLQPHSVDSGIGLYSPTTPITPKTSSSPSVSLSENSPEK